MQLEKDIMTWSLAEPEQFPCGVNQENHSENQIP